MNKRERFWRTVRFQEVDRLPLWADWLGPWKRWQEEGLPIPAGLDAEIDDDRLTAWCLDYFGFEGMYSIFWGHPRIPVEIGPYPAFEEETFEETSLYRVYRSGNGVIVRQFRDRSSSLHSTQFIEYPIKNRRDWVKYRDEHLDPHASGRYPDPAAWDKLKAAWKDRDYVISIDGGSFYGFLRDWIGFEQLSYLLYDQPALVREMMDYLGDFYVQVLHKALDEVQIDFAMFWEDMCYKSGPLLSPKMFRQLMLPNYKKVTRLLEEHGVELSWVDCDGNIEALIPLWVEGGVHGFYPLEVASDMDAGKLRAQYGKEIVLWGNVDKRALTAGPQAIDAELRRLAPVVAEGGFIPLVDHGVPDDVPLQNYLYYLEQRKKLTGWA
jgi:Uroporphyrinogen decarboxylase (URO-D)